LKNYEMEAEKKTRFYLGGKGVWGEKVEKSARIPERGGKELDREGRFTVKKESSRRGG